MAKPQNDSEEKALNVLIDMMASQKRTCLSLHPASGKFITEKPVNTMKIDEGKSFENISESFYDWCVDKFDTRYKK